MDYIREWGNLISVWIPATKHNSPRPGMRSRVRKPRKPRESIIPKDVLAKEIARILDDREITQTGVVSSETRRVRFLSW
jgi:hypothetical protein